jgi:hypothetical protein
MPAIHPAREPPARLAGWSPGGGRILLKQAAVGDGFVRLVAWFSQIAGYRSHADVHADGHFDINPHIDANPHIDLGAR